MSTSKIGRAIQPKKKVNPEFGKQDAPKKEEVDKLESALTILTDELSTVVELVQEQNKALKLLFNKMDALQNKVQKLESTILEVHNKQTEEITSSISEKLDSYKKEQEETKKSKSWFK